MTYQTSFNERQRALLEPIIREINRGSEEIIVSHESAAYISEIRKLIYAYLSPFHANLKPLFILKQINPTKLILRRRISDAPTVVVSSADPSEQFFKDYLLSVESESEALRLIQEYEPDRALRVAHLDFWRAKQ